MSFTDRDPGRTGGVGGFRHALRRIFGDAENPLGWSLPIGRVFGITVKVHLLFVVYAVAQMLWSLPKGHMGLPYTAISMAALFVLVLLHEFGHCFACRMVGGEADEIVMWPLGGLAMCSPPDRWSADLATTVGGPAVNALIVPLTSGALYLTGQADHILFNPFDPRMSLNLGSHWMVALWLTHYVNIVLLAFNVLVPMFPLDGGRMVQALLWSRHGRRRATEITIAVGFVAAGVLGVFGLVTDQTMLFGIAVFGGLMCWRERQVLRMDVDVAFGAIPEEGHAAHPRAPGRRELKRRQREADERAEVDRILAKIAATGINSLTRREKRTLQLATRRRQRG